MCARIAKFLQNQLRIQNQPATRTTSYKRNVHKRVVNISMRVLICCLLLVAMAYGGVHVLQNVPMKYYPITDEIRAKASWPVCTLVDSATFKDYIYGCEDWKKDLNNDGLPDCHVNDREGSQINQATGKNAFGKTQQEMNVIRTECPNACSGDSCVTELEKLYLDNALRIETRLNEAPSGWKPSDVFIRADVYCQVAKEEYHKFVQHVSSLAMSSGEQQYLFNDIHSRFGQELNCVVYDLPTDKATFTAAAFRFIDKFNSSKQLLMPTRPPTVSENEWLKARDLHVRTLIEQTRDNYRDAVENAWDFTTWDSDYNVTTCTGLKTVYDEACNCDAGPLVPLGGVSSCNHVKAHYQQENCCKNVTSMSVPLKPDLRQAADDAAARTIALYDAYVQSVASYHLSGDAPNADPGACWDCCDIWEHPGIYAEKPPGDEAKFHPKCRQEYKYCYDNMDNKTEFEKCVLYGNRLNSTNPSVAHTTAKTATASVYPTAASNAFSAFQALSDFVSKESCMPSSTYDVRSFAPCSFWGDCDDANCPTSMTNDLYKSARHTADLYWASAVAAQAELPSVAEAMLAKPTEARACFNSSSDMSKFKSCLGVNDIEAGYRVGACDLSAGDYDDNEEIDLIYGGFLQCWLEPQCWGTDYDDVEKCLANMHVAFKLVPKCASSGKNWTEAKLSPACPAEWEDCFSSSLPSFQHCVTVNPDRCKRYLEPEDWNEVERDSTDFSDVRYPFCSDDWQECYDDHEFDTSCAKRSSTLYTYKLKNNQTNSFYDTVTVEVVANYDKHNCWNCCDTWAEAFPTGVCHPTWETCYKTMGSKGEYETCVDNL